MLTTNSTVTPVAVTNSQQAYYLHPATAGLFTPQNTQSQPVRSGLQPGPATMRPGSVSPTAVMYGSVPASQQGMNFNIMGASKPKKLEQLTHIAIKKFKSDFTHYHHETNGQATLLGHISDDVVAIIDSLIGAEEEHQHLLGFGAETHVKYLTEEERASRP
jgi:hypothetical protein